MESVAVIIVAGGCGSRCGGAIPKQFRLLGGVPVLARTINCFAEAFPLAEIVVVLPEQHLPFWTNLAARFPVATHTTVAGGQERFHSVRRGLQVLRSTPELIAIQDGVRPLCSAEMIHRVATDAAIHGVAIPVIQPVDSFRQTDGENSHAIDRRQLRIVQTPQIFRADILTAVYATEYNPLFTDDASVAEYFGYTIYLSSGEYRNLKITTEEDFAIAEALLATFEKPHTDNDNL